MSVTTKQQKNSGIVENAPTPIKRPRGRPRTIGLQKLTERQELFCRYYTSGTEFYGNGTYSYCAAYNYDPTNSSNYKVAASAACGLLVKPNILQRINELLDSSGFNDANADKQLLFLMQQHADFTSKLGAIREYNKLKQRITQKMEHTLHTPITGIRIVPVDPVEVKRQRDNIASIKQHEFRLNNPTVTNEE